MGNLIIQVILFILSVLILTPESFAQASDAPSWDDMQSELAMAGFNRAIHQMRNPQTHLSDCYRQPPENLSNQQLACLQRYSQVMQKGKMEITIGIGYGNLPGSNGNAEVVDIQEYNSIVQILTAPCLQSMRSNCGFTRSSTNPNKLTKEVIGPNQRPLVQEINLIQPSETRDHITNLNSPRQRQRSENARREFENALTNHDVVLYSGHSRGGGGPDFFPPLQLNPATGEAFPDRSRTNITRTDSAIQRRTSRMALLGLFSCESRRHFSGILAGSQHKRETTILTGTEINDTDGHLMMMATLNGALSFSCESDFELRRFRAPISRQMVSSDTQRREERNVDSIRHVSVYRNGHFLNNNGNPRTTATSATLAPSQPVRLAEPSRGGFFNWLGSFFR